MKRVRCSYTIEGPKIDGRGNIAWRRFCKRIVVIKSDDPTPRYRVRCWQHKEAA